MLKLAGKRLALAIPLMLVVSFLIFVLMDLAPGDPALRLAGDNATDQQVEQIREVLHLDRPLPERYVRWVVDVGQGDFGKSFSTGEKVTSLIGDKMPVTVFLALLALLLTLVLGPIAGILGAVRPGGLVDNSIIVLASIATAIPSFWLAILLVIPFAIERSWLPAIGYQPISAGIGTWLSHLLLPAVALAATPVAETALQLRAAVAECLQQDYVMAARAKGIPDWHILTRHVLKNAAIPVVTVLGLRVSFLLGGAVAVEQVFALNGLGTLAVTSTLAGDVPVLLGLTLVAAAVVIVTNMLVDFSYGYFNPKVRS